MAREKRKARELKKSQWWRNRVETGICYYCGRKFLPEELTMDHVVPLSRGGKSTKGNVVPCCRGCNAEKHLLTPADMILQEFKDSPPEKR